MKLCLVCNFQFGDEQELCPKDLSKLVPIGKDPLIGKLIQDRYRIESLIAKGSMGVIYKATQELIGREVAVKVMHNYLVSDDESLKRYHKEAKAASRLNHPNITTIYDFGVLASGQPYIVMDLLTGKTLADYLKERNQLTLNQTLMVFQQVCLALAEAHKCGIVHRDIKPENIVIDEMPDGKSIQVKVVDFGIATFSEGIDDTLGKITKTGTVCGSPFYMSPEQCDASKLDHRSDLYSLGVVLFETLTGKVPFESKDIYQVLTMQVKDAPPKLKKMRPDLEYADAIESVVAKALSKEPDQRYQTADDFWLALAQAGGLKAGQFKTAKDLARAADQLPDLIKQKRAESAQKDEAKESALSAAVVAAVESEKAPPTEGAATVPGLTPDELQRKIRAATLSLQDADEKNNPKKKKKNPVTSGDRIVAFFQMWLPPLMTLVVTFALFWVVANEAHINSMFGSKYGGVVHNDDVDGLIAQEKLDQARQLLEKKKREGGFDQNDESNLDWVYIRLAKKEAKAKHFKAAAQLLELVSKEAKEQEEVKVMLKRYRKQTGGK
ncbi:MAG: serine/threonine protein kinase [Candidatus Obscuribacterales bacterium]|nr:serine/threonine protein kinase [Candidatus Obscuribacterales bacterium]